VAIIAAIFIYLLILFKRIAEKLVLIADKQTQYLQERLNVVEKYLGIDEKIIDLRDKHIKKLEKLAIQKEDEIAQSQIALTEAKDQLWKTVAALDLQSRQVKQLQETQYQLEQAGRTEALSRAFISCRRNCR
jgi:hypothetical protein